MRPVQINIYERDLSFPFKVRVVAYAKPGMSTLEAFELIPVGPVTDALNARFSAAADTLVRLIEEAGQDGMCIGEVRAELPGCASWCLERAVLAALADFEAEQYAAYSPLTACLSKPGPHKRAPHASGGAA